MTPEELVKKSTLLTEFNNTLKENSTLLKHNVKLTKEIDDLKAKIRNLNADNAMLKECCAHFEKGYSMEEVKTAIVAKYRYTAKDVEAILTNSKKSK